jgi:hypothetical protein
LDGGCILIGCPVLDNGLVQVDNMTNGGEAITDLGVDNQIGNEGDSIQVYFAYCKLPRSIHV